MASVRKIAKRNHIGVQRKFNSTLGYPVKVPISFCRKILPVTPSMPKYKKAMNGTPHASPRAHAGTMSR
ncbi:hypothetical protein D3C86_1233430 [compost metagenome]